MRSASGLAIARDSLLPVAPTSINTPFGLHPSLVELHTLWAQQKVAVVCNAGPLDVCHCATWSECENS